MKTHVLGIGPMAGSVFRVTISEPHEVDENLSISLHLDLIQKKNKETCIFFIY